MSSVSRPARVAYMITPFSDAGADRQLMELLKRLDRRRFQPSLYLSEAQGFILEELRQLDIPVIDVGHWGRNEIATYRLIAELRRAKPDIIHSWMFVANTWARIAGRLAGVPVIITSDRSMETDLARPYQILDLMLSPLSHRVIVNARAIADHVRRARLVPEKKIVTIYNGVDVQRYGRQVDCDAARRRFNLPATAPIVGMTGSFSPRKRWDVFLDSVALLSSREPAVHAICVGRGALREEMERYAGQRGLSDRVHFLGAQSDIAAVLATLDVFVLSSDDEGTPNVIMEAMCAGKPVVATDAGGTSEIVADRETGYVVPRGQPHALAHAIAQLLDNAELRTAMGRAGRSRIERQFSFETCIDRTMALYDQLLSRHAARRTASVTAA